jgi:hypothetical protein
MFSAKSLASSENSHPLTASPVWNTSLAGSRASAPRKVRSGANIIGVREPSPFRAGLRRSQRSCVTRTEKKNPINKGVSSLYDQPIWVSSSALTARLPPASKQCTISSTAESAVPRTQPKAKSPPPETFPDKNIFSPLIPPPGMPRLHISPTPPQAKLLPGCELTGQSQSVGRPLIKMSPAIAQLNAPYEEQRQQDREALKGRVYARLDWEQQEREKWEEEQVQRKWEAQEQARRNRERQYEKELRRRQSGL